MLNQLTKDCQAVWKNCLEIIRLEVSEQSFKTWFAPIKPIKLQNDVLTIEVPTPFFYEWLEEHYVYVLKKAIDAELGPNGKLEYSIVVDKGGSNNQPFTLNVRKSNVSAKPPVNNQNTNITVKKVSASNNSRPNSSNYVSPFEVPHFDPENWDTNLNPTYVFDTYIEGDCNRLARSAGMAIAKRPGITAFNPLVVYGGVGLGKI